MFKENYISVKFLQTELLHRNLKDYIFKSVNVNFEIINRYNLEFKMRYFLDEVGRKEGMFRLFKIKNLISKLIRKIDFIDYAFPAHSICYNMNYR